MKAEKLKIRENQQRHQLAIRKYTQKRKLQKWRRKCKQALVAMANRQMLKTSMKPGRKKLKSERRKRETARRETK